MQQAYKLCQMSWPPPPPSGRQGFSFANKDFYGGTRGQCPRCNACPGYETPQTAHAQTLLIYCVHCGCEAKEHERIVTEEERRMEREDDITKQ